MNCNHKIVLEIYNDKTHTKIGYYYCINCGKREKEQFGIKIISELRRKIINNLE